MASWYIWDEDNDDHIGPMVFDDLVARTWEGSITPDARVYEASVTKRWQAARDVDVVGPLLEAVAAGRPSGRHWQRFHRRRADGTLWRQVDTSGPFYAGGVLYLFVWPLLSGSMIIRTSILSGWLGLGYVVQPRLSLLWCAAVVANCALAYMFGSLTQLAWYFISDVVRDRKARIATRTSVSGAKQEEKEATIFVYELTPEIRGKLKEFESAVASPSAYHATAPPVAHDDEHEDNGDDSGTTTTGSRRTVLEPF